MTKKLQEQLKEKDKWLNRMIVREINVREILAKVLSDEKFTDLDKQNAKDIMIAQDRDQYGEGV